MAMSDWYACQCDLQTTTLKRMHSDQHSQSVRHNDGSSSMARTSGLLSIMSVVSMVIIDTSSRRREMPMSAVQYLCCARAQETRLLCT